MAKTKTNTDAIRDILKQLNGDDQCSGIVSSYELTAARYADRSAMVAAESLQSYQLTVAAANARIVQSINNCRSS